MFSYFVDDGKGGSIKFGVVSSAERLAMRTCSAKRPRVKVTTVPFVARADAMQTIGTAVWKDGRAVWEPGEAKKWRLRSVAGPEGRGYIQQAFAEGKNRK